MVITRSAHEHDGDQADGDAAPGKQARPLADDHTDHHGKDRRQHGGHRRDDVHRSDRHQRVHQNHADKAGNPAEGAVHEHATVERARDERQQQRHQRRAERIAVEQHRHRVAPAGRDGAGEITDTVRDRGQQAQHDGEHPSTLPGALRDPDRITPGSGARR
jgi:hypothetical protein